MTGKFEECIPRLEEIVDNAVLAEIQWYQRKKPRLRRLTRFSTVSVSVLGACIPLVAIWDSPAGRTLSAIVGVLITGIASLANSSRWQDRWRAFSVAQTELESSVAQWRLAIARTSAADDPETDKIEAANQATQALLQRAIEVRRAEMSDFFTIQEKNTSGSPEHTN